MHCNIVMQIWRKDGRMWQWTWGKKRYQLRKRGLKSFWITVSGVQRWFTLSRLGSQVLLQVGSCSRSSLALAFLKLESTPRFPWVAVPLVWVHPCPVKPALLPTACPSRVAGSSSGAWWARDWAAQRRAHRLALLGHHSSASQDQASSEGVVSGQSTRGDREGDHLCTRPRKLDASSAAFCRVVVWELVFLICPPCPRTHRATAAPCRGGQHGRGAGSALHIDRLTCPGPAAICSRSILPMRFLFGGHFPEHLLSYESTLWGRHML